MEGIYKISGDMAPLRKLYELKEKYKFRLIVDESMSFGVLGETGRGACEHFGLRPSDVEIVCASMGAQTYIGFPFCTLQPFLILHHVHCHIMATLEIAAMPRSSSILFRGLPTFCKKLLSRARARPYLSMS